MIPYNTVNNSFETDEKPEIDPNSAEIFKENGVKRLQELNNELHYVVKGFGDILIESEHKARHVQLHQSLDELIADYINHTKKNLSTTTIFELMAWSYQQTTNPTARK